MFFSFVTYLFATGFRRIFLVLIFPKPVPSHPKRQAAGKIRRFDYPPPCMCQAVFRFLCLSRIFFPRACSGVRGLTAASVFASAQTGYEFAKKACGFFDMLIPTLRLPGMAHSFYLKLIFQNLRRIKKGCLESLLLFRQPRFILRYGKNYHFFSITSQMFLSPSSMAKNFAFSMLGTIVIVSPRRNSAFAFVFAITD